MFGDFVSKSHFLHLSLSLIGCVEWRSVPPMMQRMFTKHYKANLLMEWHYKFFIKWYTFPISFLSVLSCEERAPFPMFHSHKLLLSRFFLL
jgi:hypothetical protein